MLEWFKGLISKSSFSSTRTWIIGLISTSIITLVGNWLWKKYTDKTDSEDLWNSLLLNTIREANYNRSPGIGDQKNPFLLKSHQELLSCPLREKLPPNFITLLQEIIHMGSLCNGGKVGATGATPGKVKGKCSDLKEILEKITRS
jgi:hypothetical protein